MDRVKEKYKLGDIKVEILEPDNSDKMNVICNDGTFRSEFKISRYEFENYKRHMNQRIKNAFKKAHQNNEEE